MENILACVCVQRSTGGKLGGIHIQKGSIVGRKSLGKRTRPVEPLPEQKLSTRWPPASYIHVHMFFCARENIRCFTDVTPQPGTVLVRGTTYIITPA